MNELINILNHDGHLVVTSRQIAEDFEKEHSKVNRDIENLIEGRWLLNIRLHREG